MKRSWQIFWHIFIWVSLILFFLTIVHNNTKMTTERLLVIFVLYGGINISLFYINYLLFIPRFLNRKQYGIYIIAVLVTMVLYGLAKYGVGLIFKEDVLMHSRGPKDLRQEVFGFWAYFTSTL